MPSKIDKPLQYLKHVGPKRAESFEKIGINTIKDLLFYFPNKHLDRSTILNSVKIRQLVNNGYEAEVTVVGVVTDTEYLRLGGKRQLFKVKFQDEGGIFEGVWFQGIHFFKDFFKIGEYYAVSSKPVITKYGSLQFAHPEADKLGSEESTDFMNTGKIIPFYSKPKELRENKIGDISLRRIITAAVEEFADDLEETLPAGIILSESLLPIKEAVKIMHFPQNSEELEKAVYRFKFEELFYLEIIAAKRKEIIQDEKKGIKFSTNKILVKQVLDNFPFKLTESQLEVLTEIRLDMESSKPMNRLLQGDVGSGKTVVALLAMCIAAGNKEKYQSLFMVPTEILAYQHYKKITELLSGTGVNVDIVIGGQKKAERESILQRIYNGESDIIIGTHALFEDSVEFYKVGLVVIDEQHRFGVMQRSRLIQKGIQPDVIVMTATPIPRTLTMTVYGDLDISVIKNPPEGRKPVQTYITSDRKLSDIYKFIIKQRIENNNRAFIVYPLVEESEKLELKAAVKLFDELSQNQLKELNVGLLHGKMHWREKEDVMEKFAAGEFDVLVSTTVIEVGIDIPEANVIIINEAHRFGLSQLHQLRGRVGRGGKDSYCILVTKPGYAKKISNFDYNFAYLSKSQIEANKTAIRLNALAEYTSGFDLSEIDAKLRGPGNIYGLEQSGFPQLKHANLIEDIDIIKTARERAFKIINKDPELLDEEHRVINYIIETQYKKLLKISTIG